VKLMSDRASLSPYTLAIRSQVISLFLAMVPFYPTVETLGPMDAPQAPAGGAGVPPDLIGQEGLHAPVPDFGQVGDHAHAIFGAIALVQLLQTLTRHPLTFIAEVGPVVADDLAIIDYAGQARLLLDEILPPAPKASVLGALVGQAQGAVHPAWGNHMGLERAGIRPGHIGIRGVHPSLILRDQGWTVGTYGSRQPFEADQAGTEGLMFDRLQSSVMDSDRGWEQVECRCEMCNTYDLRGLWKCECEALNVSKNQACWKCKRPRPDTADRPSKK
jgi:hypothetical protein